MKPSHPHLQQRLRSLPTKIAHDTPLGFARRLIYAVCCLAGSADLIQETQSSLAAAGVRRAVSRHDTASLFDWLMRAVSYQGVSDRVARNYMAEHGNVTWQDIAAGLSSRQARCPRLRSYWHFHGCRYDKLSRTCAEPDHLRRCPLPRHRLRNGRLNQTAYSLYLFIRDIAAGDLVAWLDQQLAHSDVAGAPNRLPLMRDAILTPMRGIFGVSDKVLTMVLSELLMADGKRNRWMEVGTSLIAIDSLVHNFLHRTGILGAFQAEHGYGPGCYAAEGCADIVAAVASTIDASQFNRDFPSQFPRFVQHAIWRYCAADGLDVCNGNRIDDRHRCDNRDCRLFSICHRIRLNTSL